jgi:hypothetical protein
MIKVVLIISILLMFSYSNASNSKHEIIQVRTQLIGGWAPIFFDKYDLNKLESINQNITNKRIKSIKITYSTNMSTLASNIKSGIKDKSLISEMNKIDLKDSDTTKYNHNQVIVILYFK